MKVRWFRSQVVIRVLAIALTAVALCSAACATTSSSHLSAERSPVPTPLPTDVPRTILLTSPAFRTGKPIPAQYTCSGANVSPPLAWGGVPPRTASFILLMQDVTGGNDFTHWVLFNLPAETRNLPAHIPVGGQLADGGLQGTDDAGVVGYYGPCPSLPKGSTDDYLFTLYALDSDLGLQAGVTSQAMLDAAGGHILAEGTLEGTYMLPQS